MNRVLRNDTFIGVALSLGVFVVYFSTLASTIQYEDCGELATVAATLGVAHPTGYPLLTLLGWAVAHFPFDARVIWKLNLLVAVLSSAAVFFFYKLFLLMFSRSKPEVAAASERTAAATGALVLAFSATYWSQAVSFEVYALHLVFLSAVTLLFMGSLTRDGLSRGAAGNLRWYAFAFLLGLSFANHMMTILLAPGFLYLYFATQGFGRDAWARIARAVLPFLMGLLPYLYLPLRAHQRPLMNWGNPDTLPSFLSHVSGRMYRFRMFSSFDLAVAQLKYFFDTLGPEFGYVPLVFAVLGLGFLFRKSRRMLIFSLLLFFGCLFYACNYNIPEIAPYFLQAYVIVGVWVAWGAYALLEYAGSRPWRRVAMGVCLAAVFFPLYFNYRAADESHDYAVEDYARNVLASLDSNAVILSGDFDFFSSPVQYLQLVEGIRRDVTVIDLGVLAGPWYYKQLESRYPTFIGNSKPEIDAFLQKIKEGGEGWEYGATRDELMGAGFGAVIQSFIARNYPGRPVYLTPGGATDEDIRGFRCIPDGLALRIFRGALPPLNPPREFSFRPFSKRNHVTEQIKVYYATAYSNQSHFRTLIGDSANAALFAQKASGVNPDYALLNNWVERMGP